MMRLLWMTVTVVLRVFCAMMRIESKELRTGLRGRRVPLCVRALTVGGRRLLTV